MFASLNNYFPHLRWRLAQWLELRWWRRYLSRRPSSAAYLVQKRAYWERLLDQLDWPIERDARVLDAGCGPAGVFVYLHDRQRVIALDPLLERYRHELEVLDTDDYPEVRFVRGQLESTRFADGAFRQIYCLNAINHVADWEAALDELTRLTAAGGRLLLTSDVHRHQWLLPLFRALPGDALHPQQHGAKHYRAALRHRGWRVEREMVLRQELIFEYRAWVCYLEV